MLSATPAQRGAVLLQAAVAEAALGETEMALTRLKTLVSLDDQDVLSIIKVAIGCMASNTLTRASEWTIEGGPGGDLVNLDDRVPPARAFALRLLAAWSAEDLDSFHALFQAAAADHHGRGEYLHGVFEYLVEWTQRRAEQVGNPHTLVGQLCKSIVRSGPSLTDSWGKLPGE